MIQCGVGSGDKWRVIGGLAMSLMEDSEAAANKGRRKLKSSTPGRAALQAVGEAAAKAMPGDLDAKARLAAQLAARRQGARTQMAAAHSEHTHIHLW